MRTVAFSLIFLAFSYAGEERLLLQQPALSETHIVFVFAGDLWSVPRSGGNAVRLTSGGNKTNPAFSPDGTQIAFTGGHDGNVDVFVMPAMGGVPRRLTWHPSADFVLGWTPDGKRILFSSPRTSLLRQPEIFTVPIEDGVPEKLPLPRGVAASISPEGQSIAYQPWTGRFRIWKNYRGGSTTRIWLAKLSDSSITEIPRTNSNDFNPMWAGERVYFLSDRNGPITLFHYDIKSREVREAVSNKGLDLKSASLGPDAIVYEQFGGIYLYDLKSGKTQQVPIRVQGDLPKLRPRFVNVGKNLEDATISPNGASAVFAARGEIITVPAEKGDPRNLTNTQGVMERYPRWSPDGKNIAYLSDESDEYALHLRSQNGTGEVSKIELKAGFYHSPQFSPDSRKIALVDSFSQLWYVDLETKNQVKVAQDYYLGRRIAGAWSPDSKWLAYSKALPNYMRAVYLYSLADGKSTQITDGMSDATYPVFDKNGKYLYFTASTNSGEAMAVDMHSEIASMTSSIYLVVLDKTVTSPFAPESDEEKEADASASTAVSKVKPGSAKKAKLVEDIKVDLDNIDQRILALPMPARNYRGLQVAKPGVLLALQPNWPTMRVHRCDLEKRKSDVVLMNVDSFEMSFSGEKALYQKGENWFIAPLRPTPSGPGGFTPAALRLSSDDGQGALRTAGIEVYVDPVQEWRQMYHEAWRMERDFFYDPNFHGLDLKAAEKSYEPYLSGIASRRDLTYLFVEMLSNLQVSHLGLGLGNIPEVKRVQTGLLGADYEIANGRYRFSRVYSGENWNPQLRAPLTQPGVNVQAGEYLIEVNGHEVRPPDNLYSFFEGLAGKSVVLKVGPDPDGAGAREVTVIPLANELWLRKLAWIEGNRRKVDELTNGQVAYVYMPNTGKDGLNAFIRYFYAQIDKQAIIIDERFNGGGRSATDIVEILNRKPLSAGRSRYGADDVRPRGIFGPKVMIINRFAISGGDAMPWYFKQTGTGKLIGTRTAGGLVGTAYNAPSLMDGSRVSTPTGGAYNPFSGKWEVENIGIAPDIEVEQNPALVRKGHDPQLEKAVEVVLEELKRNPTPKFHRPEYPNYRR